MAAGAAGTVRATRPSRNDDETAVSTLLLDLLTETEDAAERSGGRLRFDVDELGSRLVAAVSWITADREDLQPATRGYFGASRRRRGPGRRGAATAPDRGGRLPPGTS